MKTTIWMIVAACATSLVCGCGGESGTTQQSKATPTTVQSTTTAAANTSIKADDPKLAVTLFLDALKAGDKATTEALLTTKARAETAAHDLVVQPPGAPNASYSIGRVEQADGNDAAYVSCVWAEGDAESEFEVVWIVRREAAGWRIAGMATRLEGADEPIVLNFEDLSELEEAMREEEVADQQNAATVPPTTIR